jgi:hypothetical protein
VKWLNRNYMSWILEAEDGEVADEISGNSYDKTYRVIYTGKRYTSLEAAQTAIHKRIWKEDPDEIIEGFPNPDLTTAEEPSDEDN